MKNNFTNTGHRPKSTPRCAHTGSNGPAAPTARLNEFTVAGPSETGDEVWPCQNHQGVLRARRATSLLITPRCGDTVLVAQTAQGAWILHILERDEVTASADIRVPGAKSVRLWAPELHVESPRLRVRSAEAQASFGRVSLASEWIAVAANRLQVWSRLLHQQADSWVQQARQRITRVEGTDLSSARNLVLQGDEVARVDAGVVQVQAKNEVMIDGKRVVVG